MIDIKFLRENPDIVKENIKNKFQDKKLPLVDEVIKLDKESRELTLRCDELRSKRNTLSKQIGVLMGKGEKEEAEKVKAEDAAFSKRLAELEAEKEKMRQELLAELRAQQAVEAKPLETAPVEEEPQVEPQAEETVEDPAVEAEEAKVEETPTEETETNEEKSNEVENKEE